jgi:hypothetical protein
VVGKVDTFMVGGKCLNQLRTCSEESTPQDNMCHHVSGMLGPAKEIVVLRDLSS